MGDQAVYLERMRVGERLEAMLRDLGNEQPAEVSSWLQRWVAGSWGSAAADAPSAVDQVAALGREPGGYLRFVAQFAGGGSGGGTSAPGAEAGEWKAHVAPGEHARAGRTFWVNKATGQKRWDNPGAPGAEAPAPAPFAGVGSTSGAPAANATTVWEAVRASNGRVFWYDRSSKQKTWERPEGAPDAPDEPAASAPSDWKMFTSDKPGKEGQKWWYNTRTKEKSWERPKGVVEEDQNAPPASINQPEEYGQSAPAAPHTMTAPPYTSEPAAQPQEWTQHTTAGGKVFYYSTANKEKTWDKPAGFVPKEAKSTSPEDWTEHQTEKQGKVTYWWHNRVTGEKTWSKPPGYDDAGAGVAHSDPALAAPPAPAPVPAPAPPPAAAPGSAIWTVHRAGADKFFWYNKETKEKTWSRPEGAPAVPEVAGSPDTWEPVKTADGKEFWYNRDTREKSWVKPF